MWRQTASYKGQTDVQQLFTIHRVSKPRGAALPLHAHDEAQLIFAASGMVQVHTERGVWLIPPQLVGWIPGGMSHRLDIISDAELWMVLFHKQALRDWAPSSFPDRAFVSRIAPLLRALLQEAVAIDPASDKAELVVRLILHELTAMQDAPTFLPLPQSPLGLRLAEIAIADYRSALDLGELASRAATSVRSASRLFPAETGMTLKAWRQRVRIVWAMGQLSRGEPIARVATQAGFSSTAAFSAAFRQVTVMTPTDFIGTPKSAA